MQKPASRRMIRPLSALLILVLLIGLAGCGASAPLKIEFYENAEINVNEAVDNYDLVKSLENGTILTEKAPVETGTPGEKTVSLTVKPTAGAEEQFVFSVFVVDRDAPKITSPDRLVVPLGEEPDLLKGVTVTDNSGGEITVTVEGDYDIHAVGEYHLKYVAVDPSLNRAEAAFILSVEDHEGPRITFRERLVTNVGEEIDLLDGVRAVDNADGEIAVTVEGDYDFHTVGEYTLKYVAVDDCLNRTEEAFILSVEDHEGPRITFKAYLETTKGTKIDLLKGVSATDNSKETITVRVEGSYDFNKAGVYTLKYIAEDSSSNRTEETFTLKVKEAAVPEPETYETVTFTTSKGFSGITVNGVTYIDGYLIANKTYSLPQTYGSGLTAETKAAFNVMAAAAKEDGLNIYISSGFRSYSTQQGLYEKYVRRDGAAKADTFSARAGHSEHQSGLAFDVNIIGDAFIGTPEAIWLNDNCYQYGFILRYPQGKTNETGYKYEPWHFRYVGVELATILYNGGDWITMEDYFGITSEYPL